MNYNEPEHGIAQDGIEFTVPIAAQAKERARGGGGGRHRTTKKTREYENTIGQYAGLAMRGRPLFWGPVVVQIFARHLVPESWSKKRKELAVFKTSAPDLDNIIKSILDGMNQVVYADDAQVVTIHASKYYGDKAEVQVMVNSQVMPGPGL